MSKVATILKWLLVLGFLVSATLLISSFLIVQPRLEKIHQDIESDFRLVPHISASQFSNLDPKEVVLFDVREIEEFEVSHIAGAIQLTPNIDVDEFIGDFGELIKGKRVIFYCSVGRRSSELANRLGSTPVELGALSAQNLIGGAFSWVNQGLELVGIEQNVTEKIHPFNDYWGRLVSDKNRLSYTAD